MDSDPYTRVNRREIFRNPWLAFETYAIVHPNGASGEHALVVTPQACGVVVEDRGELLFTRQPRFAARGYITEIVKGGSRDAEYPLDTAKRELLEELGVTAELWSALGTLHEIPSIVAPPVALFLATDVTLGAASPSDEERISLVRLTIEEALGAAASGEIDDAVTVAALYRFASEKGYLTFVNH